MGMLLKIRNRQLFWKIIRLYLNYFNKIKKKLDSLNKMNEFLYKGCKSKIAKFIRFSSQAGDSKP
jgi:hypothetical protein